MLCGMVARVGIFGALLLSCIACVTAPPQVSAQTSAVSPQQQQVEDKPTRKERWTLAGIAAGVSLFGAAVSLISSIIYFVKNVKLSKQIADRTVTVESQKLLVEINKQYILDPKLFAIYDDYPKRDELLRDPNFSDKIKALGYLKLNVFEIVFAVLPTDRSSYKAWEAYFEDSLKRCPVLAQELTAQRKIYDSNLIAAYDRWLKKQPKGPMSVVSSVILLLLLVTATFWRVR